MRPDRNILDTTTSIELAGICSYGGLSPVGESGLVAEARSDSLARAPAVSPGSKPAVSVASSSPTRVSRPISTVGQLSDAASAELSDTYSGSGAKSDKDGGWIGTPLNRLINQSGVSAYLSRSGGTRQNDRFSAKKVGRETTAFSLPTLMVPCTFIQTHPSVGAHGK
jgi:hypothetical protein